MAPSERFGVFFASGATQVLRGSVALHRTFEDLASKMTNAHTPVDMVEIRPLKQFNWLLSAEQRAQVQTWISTIAKRFKASGGMISITEECEHSMVGMGVLVKATASSSSASRSKGVMVMSSKTVIGKKAAAAADKQVDRNAMMLKFFGTQAK